MGEAKVALSQAHPDATPHITGAEPHATSPFLRPSASPPSQLAMSHSSAAIGSGSSHAAMGPSTCGFNRFAADDNNQLNYAGQYEADISILQQDTAIANGATVNVGHAIQCYHTYGNPRATRLACGRRAKCGRQRGGSGTPTSN